MNSNIIPIQANRRHDDQDVFLRACNSPTQQAPDGNNAARHSGERLS